MPALDFVRLAGIEIEFGKLGIEQIVSRWKLLPLRPEVEWNAGAGPYDRLGWTRTRKQKQNPC